MKKERKTKMMKQEFEGFERATYEMLSHFKESIKMIIRDNDNEMDLDDLKDMIQEMLEDEGVELNEAYEGNIFNFISDDELTDWLWREGVCYTFERCEYFVRAIDISKGENNADS